MKRGDVVFYAFPKRENFILGKVVRWNLYFFYLVLKFVDLGSQWSAAFNGINFLTIRYNSENICPQFFMDILLKQLLVLLAISQDALPASAVFNLIPLRFQVFEGFLDSCILTHLARFWKVHRETGGRYPKGQWMTIKRTVVDRKQ